MISSASGGISAVQSSISTLHNITNSMTDVAETLAAADGGDASIGTDVEALRSIPALKQQALATQLILSTTEELFEEIAQLPRQK